MKLESKAEQIDEVLDLYSKGVVGPDELRWLIPLIQQGITRRRLIELVVGEENYELIENIE